MNKSSSVKRRFLALGSPWILRALTILPLVTLPICSPLFAAESKPSPTNTPTSHDAREILKVVRAAQASQHHTLSGQLRTGDRVVPFRFTMEGAFIRYQFGDPPETLLVHLLENQSKIESLAKDPKRPSHIPRLDQPIAGTDLCYEDIALRFLYWPNVEIIGEQTLLFRSCWILRSQPASPKDSRYSRADLWIEKESGALLQAETFNSEGRLAKRFKVTRGQKIDGFWFLKQMRIEAPIDGSTKDRAPTYLEVLGVVPSAESP
jgi:hypothetical protein